MPPPEYISPCGSTARNWLIGGILFFLALGLNLLGNGSHSLWDRDEPRYSVATRNLIESGDWVVPTFNGQNRYDKPIAIYWLMAVPMSVLGPSEFSARMAQGVCGASVVMLLFFFARRMGCDERSAIAAAGLQAVCVLQLVVSKAATTDAALLLTVVGAMALAWEGIVRGFAWWRFLLFWAVIGASVLVKGPPGVAVVLLGLAFFHQWDRIGAVFAALAQFFGRPFGSALALSPPRHADRGPGWLVRGGLALGIVVAVAAPWAVMAQLRTDGEFLRVAVGFHVVDRARTAINSQTGPVVYYLPVLLLGLFPAVAACGAAVSWAASRAHRRGVRFLCSWAIPGFLMFSLVTTKLPHYITPITPALTLLVGLWLTARREAAAAEDAPDRAWTFGAAWMGLIGLALAVGLPVGVNALGFEDVIVPAVVVGLVAGAGAIAGAWLWWRRLVEPALGVWIAGTVVLFGMAALWLLPALEPLRPSKILTTLVREKVPQTDVLLAGDYREDSLVFYWGDVVRMIGNARGNDALCELSRTDAVVTLIVSRRRWDTWTIEDYPTMVPAGLRVLHEGDYYLFQRGRWDRLMIVTNAPK